MDTRELRDRQLSVCFRKSHYPTEQFAARAVLLFDRNRRDRKGSLVTYRCACGGGWCIGRRVGDGWEEDHAAPER